jgi:hypothetical protein
LQDSVTHSINELLLPWSVSVAGAAALAAGDKLRGTGRGVCCVDEGIGAVGSSWWNLLPVHPVRARMSIAASIPFIGSS